MYCADPLFLSHNVFDRKSISEFDSTVDSLLETVETSSVSTVLVFAFDKVSLHAHAYMLLKYNCTDCTSLASLFSY